MTTNKKTDKPQLPPLPDYIKAADGQYGKTPWAKLRERGLDADQFLLYCIKDTGWVVCTLHISNPSRNQRNRGNTAARFYSMGLKDGKVWRVGLGPHVLGERRVYLTEDNWERLQPLVDLYLKGMGDAGQIRDRISSRRAQGTLRRGGGVWGF